MKRDTLLRPAANVSNNILIFGTEVLKILEILVLKNRPKFVKDFLPTDKNIKSEIAKLNNSNFVGFVSKTELPGCRIFRKSFHQNIFDEHFYF